MTSFNCHANEAADVQLLWRGQEAFEAALELIASAENGVRQHHQQTGTAAEQFVWRQDILRPAADAKQVHGQASR